jgi:hypothetical protein
MFAPTRRTKSAFRPGLEHLEDRTTPTAALPISD